MNPLRALGHVVSYGLNILSPPPWPMGAAAFDEIFDERAPEATIATLEEAVAPFTLDSFVAIMADLCAALVVGDFSGAIAATLNPDELSAAIVAFLSPSSADGLAHSQGPLAEDSPAPVPTAGAGHPNLSRDDFMDAANAANHMAKGRIGYQQHWRDLGQRLESAAIAAPK